jgi:hypothetical protein
MRITASGPLPGEYGATERTGLAGKVCATALGMLAAVVSTKRAMANSALPLRDVGVRGALGRVLNITLSLFEVMEVGEIGG